jgi:hypothetical protein
MKKLTLLLAAFGLVGAVHAQAPFGLPVKAIGYDADLQSLTARLPLGNADLDVGLGFKFDNAAAEPFSLTASGFYLMKTNTWGPVSNYVALGGIFKVLDQANDNIEISAFAGLQPELILAERFLISTRFGASLSVLPEFVVATAGPANGVSVVGGLNFKVLF